MGAETAIAWTDHTFNPWIGCARVSPGCQHCYAEQWAKRSGLVEWGTNAARRRTSEINWRKPIAWNHAARTLGRRELVFCASLADVFEDRPELAPWRADLFNLIEQTPNLTWQLLTKRPENVLAMVPAVWRRGVEPADALMHFAGWPSNVWIGTTVEDQQRADERIPHLLDIPAPVRFLSCEPLLGHVDLVPWLVNVQKCARCDGTCSIPVDGGGMSCPDCLWDIGGQGAHTTQQIQWVIVGGESGPGHRPLEMWHARTIVRDCIDWQVPVFFKQVGGRTPTAGGDQLDGRTIKQFPAEAQR